MARGFSSRLRKLRNLLVVDTPCECRTVTDPIDWTHATTAELRRFIELSKAAELVVARECQSCGKKTVTADQSRLSPADQIELEAIALAVRERYAEGKN